MAKCKALTGSAVKGLTLKFGHLRRDEDNTLRSSSIITHTIAVLAQTHTTCPATQFPLCCTKCNSPPIKDPMYQSSHCSTPCLKKLCKIVLSEHRQIPTNFDNFWQIDGKEVKIMGLLGIMSLYKS